MRVNLSAGVIALLVAAHPVSAAIVTTEEFHAAQSQSAALLLVPRLEDGVSRSTVLLEAALFNVVRHNLDADIPAGSVALVPKSRKNRERPLLQFGSAALSQGAIYAHSMVGLFDLLHSDAWRGLGQEEWSTEATGLSREQTLAQLGGLAQSDVAISLYSILAATAFAASPFYLALGSLAAETLLAVPGEATQPFALFVAAAIAGVVLMGSRRGR